MVDDVVLGFPKTLSGIFSTVVDTNRPLTRMTHISVRDDSMPWLIKVNKDRCPVCGTVERSINDWCDPRPEMDCDE